MSRADDNLSRMRADRESDWPYRLLRAIGNTPLVASVPKQAKWATQPRLTTGELRALEYASHGLTTKMIGDACHLSEETIKTYLASARYKLRAKNTTHACCEALRRDLIV